MAGSAMQVVPYEQNIGLIAREELGSREVRRVTERDTAAVQAREEAIIKAEYLMSERHPRKWMDVRAAMLDHCSRPRFAEIARYAKPVGKRFVNGEWIEEKARGWTARFAETLRQEMGNIKPVSQVTYEDDLLRIVRFGVTDLEKNIPRYREVAFAKTVEKRGKKVKGKNGQPETFEAPEGRELISQRINSYGEPTFLVKATDDEMRNKVNSEESKTQRDFTLGLCPRDILDECLDRVQEVIENQDAADPQAAVKKLLDGLHRGFGLIPSDLENYIGKPVAQWGKQDANDLRELANAMREGQTTFQEALKIRYTAPEDGEAETKEQRVERLKRQMDQQYQEVLARESAQESKPEPKKAAGKAKDLWAALQEKYGDLPTINALAGLGYENWNLVPAAEREAVCASIDKQLKS